MSLRRARSPEKLVDWVRARFAPSHKRSAVLMYGLLASLAYQVLTCLWWPGDLCCEARHPRQTHFQRVAPAVQAVHTDETKLLTHVCQAADWQRLCSYAHNVFLARADVRSRCGLRNCLGYM